MSELPQVAQKYQHKKCGEVDVLAVVKRGRGDSVCFKFTSLIDSKYEEIEFERLKEFQKATA